MRAPLAGPARALALALLFCVTPLRAQEGDFQHTEATLQLFRDTCAAHYADLAKVAEVAAQRGYAANPPYSAELLNGMRGQVWDAAGGGKYALALLLLDSVGGKACQVHARNTDPELLQRRFRTFMEGLRNTGMVLVLYDQRSAEKGPVTLTQTGYFLAKGARPEGWSFMLTTSTPNAGGWHATFTVAPAQRDRQ
jgi:hypothetical protein